MKCLLIANNLPPVRGGSAVVYDNLCRWSDGDVIAIGPRYDYRTGRELPDWRKLDASAPFKTYRIDQLRPFLTTSRSRLGGLRAAAGDLLLMFRIWREILAIIKAERIDVVCIGELVYGSWLAFPCRYLLGTKVVQYVHGEEVTNRLNDSVAERLKPYSLRFVDLAIAVSNFTKSALVGGMRMDPSRIEVIFNGVDTRRFTPRPRRVDLVSRYGLDGKQVILTVGRLVERKGFDQTMRALPQVLCEFPSCAIWSLATGRFEAL